MQIDLEAILQTFLAESQERLLSMEEALLTLEQRPHDETAIQELFRHAHTLKGDAGTFGFTHVTALSHTLEDLLERLRDGTLVADSSLISALLEAVDALREMIPAAAAGEDAATGTSGSVLRRLEALSARGENGGARENGKSRSAGAAAEQERTRVGGAVAQRAATLRVGLDKLDRLLDLTGEIGVARGRYWQLLDDPKVSREALRDAHTEADLLYLELQELVMKARMVPVGPTFRHLVRSVRDLAGEYGKAARLELSGEGVEVDTTVIEHLRDPLTHMIRNAIHHGIERPEERQARGKDPCGVISLRASHDAGSIVIKLEDDGAGLDRSRIARRAVELGLVPEGRELGDRELDELVFRPGFTTSESINELSGRGVGMDVVARNIGLLRGSVQVASRPGEGTTVTIRLPLTLAIIEGLHVQVEQESFILPIDAVTENLVFEPEGGYRDGGRGVLWRRGRSLPYVRLRDLFGVDGPPPSRENLVVVSYRDGEVGLVVDELCGRVQTVIKPLAKLFGGLVGVSGSAILGDGNVALILDVASLIEQALDRVREVDLGPALAGPESPQPAESPPPA